MSRQYLVSGKAVEAVLVGKKSFKSYCSTIKIGKVDYLLAAETLKYSQLITELLATAGVNPFKVGVNYGIFLVMIYELLFGKKKISGGGAVRRKVMEFHTQLSLALEEKLQTNGTDDPASLLPEHITQAASINLHVRVNTFKTENNDNAFRHVLSTHDRATWDHHIPSLIVLPPGSRGMGEHAWVKEGRLVIQDKASCMPAFILYSKWVENRGDCIDACAAPGNKTSQLAALVSYGAHNKDFSHERRSTTGTTTKVYAFDKSRARSELLQCRMNLLGASEVVSVQNKDFLSVDVNDSRYANVTCILLDPSCSGSGVVRALERVVEEGAEDVTKNSRNHRLDLLRQFQISAIRKAMSFPSVTAISYSTCSVHIDENESVVAEIINSEHGSAWQVEAPKCMADWQRRGVPCPDLLPSSESDKLIRCDPSDGCNGFFVALFTKKQQIRQQDENLITPREETTRRSVFSSSRLLSNFVWASSSLWRPVGSELRLIKQ